jgi:aquaporin Z
MGQAVGSAFQSRADIRFLSIEKGGWWDAVFYCIAQLVGAVTGVALASLVLHGAPAHKAVRYAATVPGIYGVPIAFAAELTVLSILMSAVLFALTHQALEPYTHYIAAISVVILITFESPLSGMSANPARTFGPALYAGYWHASWIYFVAPPLGMLAAAQVLVALKSKGPHSAKLHQHNNKRCIFYHS